MKVQNMISTKGKLIPKQFLITEEGKDTLGNFRKRETFQSYDSIIAIVTYWPEGKEVTLDADKWDYSKTTRKYLSQFLEEDTAETRKAIQQGIYKLANLN